MKGNFLARCRSSDIRNKGVSQLNIFLPLNLQVGKFMLFEYLWSSSRIIFSYWTVQSDKKYEVFWKLKYSKVLFVTYWKHLIKIIGKKWEWLWWCTKYLWGTKVSTVSNHPVVLSKSRWDIHIFRSLWIVPLLQICLMPIFPIPKICV